MAQRTVLTDTLRHRAEHRRATLRTRARGQSQIMSIGMSLVIAMMLFTGFTAYRAASDREEQDVILAQDMSLIADACARYIVNNYPAFEKAFDSQNILIIAPICTQNTTGASCIEPSSRAAGNHTIADDGYLSTGRHNNNILRQQYIMVVARSTTPNVDHGTTYYPLQAILTTAGRQSDAPSGISLNDDRNASIVTHSKFPASFIPLNGLNSTNTNAPWLFTHSSWGGALTAGHVAISLDAAINQAVNNNTIKRFNGGSTAFPDVRPQTLGRTIYFGHDSATGQNANLCFCAGASSGVSGSYKGPCALPAPPSATTANPDDYNANGTPKNVCTAGTW